jgi:hypothetical protein
MNQKFEAAVTRKKILMVDRDEARKTATGFSCITLGVMPGDCATLKIFTMVFGNVT